MKRAIRQRALELGFDECRFTMASPPESAPKLRDWLAQGNHGQMAYLERNAAKRTDPQLVLPGAKSIIVLAVSYHCESQAQISSPVPGILPAGESAHSSFVIRHSSFVARPQESRASSPTPEHFCILPPSPIARYAHYPDYHDLLASPLKTLSDFVTSLGPPSTRSLWYVDTGPVLERDLAQRAGIGFAGKHANLVSRDFGNWLLLAEILTTLDLEPDPPQRNLCGSCTRCISACPTRAITAPFQLDARRCISYLTIELKGPIPEDLRPDIGNRIFGCDDCLEACPWNRFAREGSLMKPHHRKDLAAPDLIELLSLDDAEFKRRFQDTPMLRTKRRGLLRNVCVALGNSADPRAIPALQEAQTDPEPLIAEHAIWAIQQLELAARERRADGERVKR